VGVHHDHAIVGQDDRGVGVHFILRRGDGGIDAIRHRLEFEEIFAGGDCIGREGATEIEVIDRLDGCSREPHAGQKLSTGPVRVHPCSSSHRGDEDGQSGPAVGASLPHSIVRCVVKGLRLSRRLATPGAPMTRTNGRTGGACQHGRLPFP
jgi:hypothetical protein